VTQKRNILEDPLRHMANSQEEQQYFAQLYSFADLDRDGKISGGEGAPFLRKSGLPDNLLERIWDLADSSKTGYLQPREFAIAMRLVTLAQEGKPVELQYVHNVSGLPRFADIPFPIASSMPPFTEQEIFKYDNLFLQADSNQDGFIDGNEAKTYFSKGKLATEKLAKIWELCERDKDGKLSRGEFRLAMYLIYWSMKGNSLPDVIPMSVVQQALTAPSQVSSPPSPPILPQVSLTPQVPIMQTQQIYPQQSVTNMSQQHTSFSNQTSQGSFSQSSNGLVFNPSQGFNNEPSSNNGLVFTPADAQINYNQSKQIAQYTLPGASFEMRVNFNNDLQSAINKRKPQQ